MDLQMMTRRSLAISILTMASATLLPWAAFADAVCTGHDLLSTPRPEASCQTIKPEIYAAPDKKLHASVLAVDVSLYATPDMESRVVIRSVAGDTLNSMDHASPRGTNGYYVDNAQWSPDSQFFVYSMISSGGHSPWSFPIMVYSVERNAFAKFSGMINGAPSLSGQFQLSGPHTLTAKTWKQPGALDNPIPISVDLEAAFAKLKPSSN